MSLSDLEGMVYGPVPWRVAVDAVTDFIEVTGDDLLRWSEIAPPGFAAAGLFAVAPELLEEMFDRSVIHGEQTFAWDLPLQVGALLRVHGTVTRVRERGGVHFITFEVEAADGDQRVLTGRSLFLVSGEAIPGGPTEFERPEPPHSYRGEPEEGQVSASRAELVRYASATRDWNPVHWDHVAGVTAGFPGVVVHGLLQAAWALRAAGAGTVSTRPIATAKFRFRNPFLPGRPADLSLGGQGNQLDVVLSDVATEYMTATISLSDE